MLNLFYSYLEVNYPIILFMIVKWFIVADGLWLLHGFCLLMVSVYGWLMVADGLCLLMVEGQGADVLCSEESLSMVVKVLKLYNLKNHHLQKEIFVLLLFSSFFSSKIPIK